MEQEKNEVLTLDDNEEVQVAKAIIDELVKMEKQAKKIEARQQAIKAELLKAMEKYQIKKFENESIAITYVEPTVRVSLDSKALKENDFDVYLKYAKESPVKGSVRITCK